MVCFFLLTVLYVKQPPITEIDKFFDNIMESSKQAVLEEILSDGNMPQREFPFQVQIFRNETDDNIKVCSGAIISHNHILTAANCVEKIDPMNLFAVIGMEKLGGKGLFLDVKEITIYPKYKGGRLDHDIAVLSSQQRIPLHPKIVDKIVLNEGAVSIGSQCESPGFGTIELWDLKYSGSKHLHSPSNYLKSQSVYTANTDYCLREQKKDFNSSMITPESFICAGNPFGDKHTCQGDLGSPLVCGGKLAGVMILGYCNSKLPGYYVNVAHYSPWIMRVLRPHTNIQLNVKQLATVSSGIDSMKKTAKECLFLIRLIVCGWQVINIF